MAVRPALPGGGFFDGCGIVSFGRLLAFGYPAHLMPGSVRRCYLFCDLIGHERSDRDGDPGNSAQEIEKVRFRGS